MKSRWSGCHELRIDDISGAWRIVYKVAPASGCRDVPTAPAPVRRDPVRRPAMNASRKKRLRTSGWAVGTARDFLNLSEQESAYIEIKLRLATLLSKRRKSLGITQVAMAKKLGSSQSRVAKMEAADASVSLDLLIRILLVLGASRREVAHIIALETKHAA